MFNIITDADQIAFIVLALIILVTALLMLEVKDLSHSIIFLAMSFIGIAGLYILLSAEFLFAFQLTVYAGGVVVLFLFALMLTRTQEFVMRGDIASRRINIAVIVVLILLFVFFMYPARAVPNIPDYSQWNIISGIGIAFFGTYQAGYIILGFLLIGVILGAIYLLKNEGEIQPILDRTDLTTPYQENSSSSTPSEKNKTLEDA